MAAAAMRRLRGPDAAVDARTKAVSGSSREDRVRFVLESARLLREFLVDAEWRAPALREIADAVAVPDAVMDGNADELGCTVAALFEVFDSFRDYVLFGEGQGGVYAEPQTDVIGLPDAAPALPVELERRLMVNDRKAAVEAIDIESEPARRPKRRRKARPRTARPHV